MWREKAAAIVGSRGERAALYRLPIRRPLSFSVYVCLPLCALPTHTELPSPPPLHLQPTTELSTRRSCTVCAYVLLHTHTHTHTGKDENITALGVGSNGQRNGRTCARARMKALCEPGVAKVSSRFPVYVCV